MTRNTTRKRTAINADDGYGVHIESGLTGVALCGRTFPTNAVERETYDPSREEHQSMCFDCSTVQNRARTE